MNFILVFLLNGIITFCRGDSIHKSTPRLLLVSFDGFRADYMETYNLPYLQDFIKDGVLVEHVTNAFITKTFPNHYSIVTGLYEETHGIVANTMYDAATKKNFSSFNDADAFWWDEAIPIWVTNQWQENKTSAAAMWPGTDVRIHNTTPHFFMKYNSSVSFSERVENIIRWLNSSNPLVTFATLYWEEPDASGHKYGPEDKENMSRVLEEVDKHIGLLVKRLKASKLWEEINVIITSDHGMAQCSPGRLINLDDCVDPQMYMLIDKSPVAAILPFNETYVYESLKKCNSNMTVYRKGEIPDRYHYYHNERIQPIIVVAKEGWTIVQNQSLPRLGDHGYDNAFPSMHPFLAAHGPAFRKGYWRKTMNTVDIYPMMCHILGLTPQPNNGTLSNSKCLLADQWCINIPEAIGIVIGVLMVLTTLTCLIIIMKNRTPSLRPFSRLQLQEDDDDPLIG
ncbi:bis(5'-adenosyl)-triphosphatase ENPP4 [Sphaerodactylus townsendi]|uniref:bis(5'-adenosyl)-triphosphatase ENPP4 n=1 Tax=Sphaerodactylus townsendi TaxID=933632 RepID=UPI002027424C|nr:bis(5'-adenosyl)-triphosphatase ENPP4 [Sphaerodactylus townsendi]XP_048358826.1 bis(5'-adenosyl)-triphosphatase ENPP4 [Sphaerodactylus townsendi]XP_048358836.1 bis(5'-adenosyl)-triphosphatase ENPP4 [Sphaerodactylus townsendi]XP_048358844.1 bis(5'-adenosyl)-triphosphatase ENPP4 [Sphaerodactylus townsendi]XP_048358853.1 bis(5'-adenosyl)-triphosphatase ENPP4 [Sphaerodactylus townsendi]